MQGEGSYLGKLRSSSSNNEGSANTLSNDSAQSSKKRKSNSTLKGSGKKTPKRQNHDEPKENMTEIVDSKSSFKNLNSAFEEQVGKLRSPVVDFGVDILQSLKILRPTLPRHKRTPVRNVNLCSDVAENVLEMCFEQEERYLTSWDYMAHQPTLNWKMREILVDWIIDVHKKMRLSPHSLWLTVNLVDRTLASCVIERVRLQLVGIAALSLACKLDEVRAPYPGDLTYITDGAYTTGDLLDMELRVWKAVNYELIVPSGYNFIIHFLDTIHASDVTRSLALYYGERNLQEVTHLSAKPSVYAAACVYAAISQRLQQGEPVCSDLPSEERTRSTETLKPLRISLTDNVNKHSSDMTPTTDTVDDATVPQSSASGEAAMPIGEPSDAATEAILETVIETAAGSVTGCGPAIQQTHSTGMIEIDRCCQPVVVVPAPIRESRDRSILTEVILWGLNLTRRAPVRITAETETVTVRDGASKAPAASQSNHNSAFSPPFASPTDTITSKSNSSNIESNVTGHALIATSSAAAAKTSTSGGASSNAAVSVHAKVAGAERFEEDVTEEEVRHGAEKISQELSPEDVRNLPSLARALVAMAAIVTENRTTRICLHRQLDSAQRKYATISRMCVSNLPLPFEAAVAEAEELSVPTRQHGPILIKAGKCYFAANEMTSTTFPPPYPSPPSASKSGIPASSSNSCGAADAAGLGGTSSSSNSSSSSSICGNKRRCASVLDGGCSTSKGDTSRGCTSSTSSTDNGGDNGGSVRSNKRARTTSSSTKVSV